jgi:hypothetical protein
MTKLTLGFAFANDHVKFANYVIHLHNIEG